MTNINLRLSEAGIAEQVSSQEIKKLRKHDDDTDAIVRTLQAVYDNSVHGRVFSIPNVGILRGHFLLKEGYNSVEDIAAVSEHEIMKVSYIGETSAPKIIDGARDMLDKSNRSDEEWHYLCLNSEASADEIRCCLAEFMIGSETLCLVVDGYDTSLSTDAIRNIAEGQTNSVRIHDHRRHKLEADLDEIECIASDFTYNILNHTTSVPEWLTGTHYFRAIKPVKKYEHYDPLPVVGLYRYQPMSKNPNKQSQRLYRFAKDSEPDKGIQKAIADLTCRRFLRASDSYDTVVAVPSHNGGYSKSIKITGAMLDKSTPLSYRRLLTRKETTTQQKELNSKKERWENVAGSISVTTDLENTSIILIDDICTSGASLCTAAHELRKAGADEVVGLVYGLNTGWGDLIEIDGPGATMTHIKRLDKDEFR